MVTGGIIMVSTAFSKECRDCKFQKFDLVRTGVSNLVLTTFIDVKGRREAETIGPL